jgi:ABC-type branched-subunit amino acid transport system ATPase component
MSLLQVSNVSKRFGGVVALKDITLQVNPCEILGLIGPNGSGKTTLLNVMSGFYQPDSGSITYSGTDITGLEPSKIAQMGVTRTFQVTKIFRRVSVLENLLVPGLTHWSTSLNKAREKAMEILELLQLTRLAYDKGSDLSGGQAKLLEFGRLMMLDPKAVLLDEPFGGVHPELKQLMHDVIEKWNHQGVTIVLISHDMGSIFGLCRRVMVLDSGKAVTIGTPEVIRKHSGVLEAYLGATDAGEGP